MMHAAHARGDAVARPGVRPPTPLLPPADNCTRHSRACPAPQLRLLATLRLLLPLLVWVRCPAAAHALRPKWLLHARLCLLLLPLPPLLLCMWCSPLMTNICYTAEPLGSDGRQHARPRSLQPTWCEHAVLGCALAAVCCKLRGRAWRPTTAHATVRNSARPPSSPQRQTQRTCGARARGRAPRARQTSCPAAGPGPPRGR
jgi:hypothetical protein